MDNNNPSTSNNKSFTFQLPPSFNNSANVTPPLNNMPPNFNAHILPPYEQSHDINQRPPFLNFPPNSDHIKNIPPPPLHSFSCPPPFHHNVSQPPPYHYVPPSFNQSASSTQSHFNPSHHPASGSGFCLPTIPFQPPMLYPQASSRAMRDIKPASMLPSNEYKKEITLEVIDEKGPVHPLTTSVTSFKKDQDLVNKWIENKLTSNQSADQFLNTSRVPKNISDVHNDIATFKSIMAELKRDVSSHHIKEKMNNIAFKISNLSYQERVKNLVASRRKKRRRQRKSRKLRIIRYKTLEKEIDNKMELVINAEKNEKKKKQLQQEADSVLKEVRTKKSDTDNFLKLLANVEELRENRLKRGAQQGFVSDEHQDKYFKIITGRLKEMIESHYDDYLLEERTLNAMIDQHQNEGNEEVHSSVPEEVCSTTDILRVYFGSHSIKEVSLYESYTSADSSSEMMSNRRFLWNKYTSDEGSEVPAGWTLPLPGGIEWKKWRTN